MTADRTLPDRLKTGQSVIRPAVKGDEPRKVHKTSRKDGFGEPLYQLSRRTEYGTIKPRTTYSRDDLAALGFALVDGGA